MFSESTEETSKKKKGGLFGSKKANKDKGQTSDKNSEKKKVGRMGKFLKKISNYT